jgi:hypothetical protein
MAQRVIERSERSRPRRVRRLEQRRENDPGREGRCQSTREQDPSPRLRHADPSAKR